MTKINTMLFCAIFMLFLTMHAVYSAPATQQEPCYVVLVTDVSGSMNKNDHPFTWEKKKRALRDDGQQTFLYILPVLRDNNYIGACTFSDKIKKVSTDSMVAWNSQDAMQSRVEKLINSVDISEGGTRIDMALDWARERITMARQTHGYGAAKVVLLSDGDPDGATRWLGGKTSPVITSMGLCKRNDIQIYPIIINRASYRDGSEISNLTGSDKAAEKLMELIANETAGKIYRLTPSQDFIDIFTDITGSGWKSSPSNMLVSAHHRTAIFIGSHIDSIKIQPNNYNQPYDLKIEDGIDGLSGINQKIIKFAKWEVVILKRPADGDKISKYWTGSWNLKIQETPPHTKAYFVTDFFLDLNCTSPQPLWCYEKAHLTAILRERPKEVGETTNDIPGISTDQLTFKFTLLNDQGGMLTTVQDGQWDRQSLVFKSNPLIISEPGKYQITCECLDNIHGMPISLGTFSDRLQVELCPVKVGFVDKRSSNIIYTSPYNQDYSRNTTCNGGDSIYAEVVSASNISVKNIKGAIALSTNQNIPFRTAENNRIATEPFELPLDDSSLSGTIELSLTDKSYKREIELPAFTVNYGKVQPRLTEKYTDNRIRLWKGEYHRQNITFTVCPVRKDAIDRLKQSFPKNIPNAKMTLYDIVSGQMVVQKVISLECQLVEPVIVDNDERLRSITATYQIRSNSYLPACSQSTIDLGEILPGMYSSSKTYDVIDPVESKLFTWSVTSDHYELDTTQGVASNLYWREPIYFKTQWDQNIRVVSIKSMITGEGLPNAETVPLDIKPDKSQSTKSYNVVSLAPNRNYTVVFDFNGRIEGENCNLQLYGGEFVYKKKDISVQYFSLGSRNAEDIEGYPYQTVQVPINVGLKNIDPENNKEHKQIINTFKDSVKIKLFNEAGESIDLTSNIGAWRKDTSGEQSQQADSYRYSNCIEMRLPQPGTYILQFEGTVPTGQDKSRINYEHTDRTRVTVDYPPFALHVRHNDSLLFDINDAAGSEKPYFNPQRAQFSAKLTANIKINTQVIQLTNSSKILLIPYRKGGSSDLPIPATREDNTTYSWNNIELHEPGFYLFKILLTDVKDLRNQRTLTEIPYDTPFLIEIYHQDVRFTLLPSQFITKRTRTWPFEIRMEVPDDINASRCLFQYRFPGENISIDGVCTGNTNRRDYVTLKDRDIMPALEKAQNGKMTFYLSLSGKNDGDNSILPLHPEVIIEDSPLKCIEMKNVRSQNNSIYTCNEGDTIEARVVFNHNPRLENIWKIKNINLYIFPSNKIYEPQKQLGCNDIETILEKSKYKKDNYQNISIPPDPNNIHEWKNIVGAKKENTGLISLLAKWMSYIIGKPTFGWKTTEKIIVASVEYLPNDVKTADYSGTMQKSLISEWTEVSILQIKSPPFIPLWCWLLFTAFLISVYIIILYFIKINITNPEELGLTIYVDETAFVYPSKDSKCFVQLMELTLAQDLQNISYDTSSKLDHFLRLVYNINKGLGMAVDIATFILSTTKFRTIGRHLLPVRWACFSISLNFHADKKEICFVYLKVCRNVKNSTMTFKTNGYYKRYSMNDLLKKMSVDVPIKYEINNRTKDATVVVNITSNMIKGEEK